MSPTIGLSAAGTQSPTAQLFKAPRRLRRLIAASILLGALTLAGCGQGAAPGDSGVRAVGTTSLVSVAPKGHCPGVETPC